MPDRILRDELLTSERYWSVSIEAQRLFVHLILCADDTGRFSGKNYTIRTSCFPGQSVDPGKLENMLSELVDVDLVRMYQHNDERFIFLPRFRQRLRYLHSRYPEPPIGISDIPKEKTVSRQSQDGPRPVLSQSQVGNSEVKRSEVKRSEVKKNTLSGSPSANADLLSQSRDVLQYLNKISGHHFKPLKSSLTPIIARLKEGYSPARLREIAFLKTEQWGKDEKMMEYLRPITLYAAKNCAAYDGVLPNGVDDAVS